MSLRKKSEKEILCGYYRLVESYRNADDRICHRTILNVGFLDHFQPEKLNKVQKMLTHRAEGKISIFEEEDHDILELTNQLWERIVSEKRIDMPENTLENRKRLVDIETIKHKDIREVGCEWLCLQTLSRLQVPEFLATLGWDEEQIKLTLTQIIGRAVYPASELATTRWIRENSAVCEVTGYPIEKITKDKLYQNALSLFEIKDLLEKHLSKRTNELFDIEDSIILYDLTNTYFEGEKANSKLAKFGRSKEKRSDARLVVLALVINPEGFLKYSNVFEGNKADSTSLSEIIDKLRVQTSGSATKCTVVMDAGIATEGNLAMLKEKGYDYVCISRKTLKDYKLVEGSNAKVVKIASNKEIQIEKVSSERCHDYYLKVKSPGKELKETSMKNLFEDRFEEGLKRLKSRLSKKNAIKKVDKIHESIGRYREKYPSVSKYYSIEIKDDGKGVATDIVWEKSGKYEKIEEHLGVYFIRTSREIKDEGMVWKIYNTIREVESSFRTLKTDLDLRPIYHKNDDATMAHLHLGLLAYWVVNTIRFQLKKKDIKHGWTEVVRIANTQKMITTSGTNQDGLVVSVRRCSDPDEKLKCLYNALKFKQKPFNKQKSVVHKPEIKKTQNAVLQKIPPN